LKISKYSLIRKQLLSKKRRSLNNQSLRDYKKNS
jgi:hypothetical protein